MNRKRNTDSLVSTHGTFALCRSAYLALLPNADEAHALISLEQRAASDSELKLWLVALIDGKNEAGEQKEWYIDLKETGEVGKGLAPEGKKPSGTFVPCRGIRPTLQDI